jgi:hypothetical protein
LDELNSRIDNLDSKFEKEKKEILEYIDERGKELTAMLNAFKVRDILFNDYRGHVTDTFFPYPFEYLGRF